MVLLTLLRCFTRFKMASTRYGEVDLSNCPCLKGPYGVTNTVRFVSPFKYAIRVDTFTETDTPTSFRRGVKIMDNYGQIHGPFWVEYATPHERSNGNPWARPFVCYDDNPAFSTPLPPSLIDLLKSDTVLPIISELTRKDDTIREKDERIAALEARVREIELLEAKVKALEAQIEYTTIPRIHLVSSPKPVATSNTTLLDLDDFFSTSSGYDIGNLPEFVHESP
jgi:hypothetical protein